MPIRPISRLAALLALAAALFAAASGDRLAGLFPEPTHLYGGMRTQRGVSDEVLRAITLSDHPRIHVLLQFDRYLHPREEALLEAGFNIDILEAVPENAYIVSLPRDRVRIILDQLKRTRPSLRGALTVRPADKLSPALGRPGSIEFPEHALVENGQVEAVVHFFADLPWQEQGMILQSHKAGSVNDKVHLHSDNSRWQVEIPLNAINSLLQEDQVRWIESIPAPPADDLDNARVAAGYSGSADGGSGVLIAQWESCQPLANHPGLLNRIQLRPHPVVQSDCATGQTLVNAQTGAMGPKNFHATMVAGIMIGDGTGSQNSNLFGMAGKANALAYEVDSSQLTLSKDYLDAISLGATISQNSWGPGCEIYADPQMPLYTSGSALFDKIVSGRNFIGRPSYQGGRMLVVASAGNYGDQNHIPSLWGSVRVSNSAKNVLTVGNVNSQTVTNSDHWAHISSGRGPTSDGRIAPILSAPGIVLNNPPTGIDTTYPPGDTNPPELYKKNWGTSFSTPVVTGAAALLTETYRQVCSAEPSPTELRALLIHTAHDLKEAHSTLDNAQPDPGMTQCGFSPGSGSPNVPGFTVTPAPGFSVLQDAAYEGPDYIYGYGMVQADKAVDFANKSHFVEGEINSGYVEYDVAVNSNVLDDDKQFRVTLVWDDPPWPINIPPSSSHGLLQNDLDLELISPSGKHYLPWVLDPEHPAKPASRHSRGRFLPITMDTRDQRNTIEQVAVETTEFGTWTIRVRGGRMLRPVQTFALVSLAINPAGACGDIPFSVVENPVELPGTWFYWLLFWVALLILILLLIELVRFILNSNKTQKAKRLDLVGFILLLLGILWLLYESHYLVLAAVMLVLLVLAALIT
jgi:hypothetical protein